MMEDLLDTTPPKNSGQFGKGNPGKPKGATNKLTAIIKDAIRDSLTPAALRVKRRRAYEETYKAQVKYGTSQEEAARIAQKAADAVTEATPADYFDWLADAEPKAYATLLGKLLPTKLAGSDDPDDAPVRLEAIERRIVKPKGKE
jgi:hypothetical protein